MYDKSLVIEILTQIENAIKLLYKDLKLWIVWIILQILRKVWKTG